ncbi:unnamed protein product [Eruca vesicaria subsp. sativa]|uniref:BSD domain-containing protein n=1 Tax=Eruca vesicaria subsp. sativa TaxID=29727 RepID=A0ABC8KK47_ERUVS|nr:unnamed protein product [Eruca vesicaria subsp. sativa]
MDDVAVNDEVLAFARNIAMHPETWLDFPLDPEEDLDDLEMSDAQRGHALAIERLAPRLAALRIELCPCHMTVGYFCNFVLLLSRLNKHDAQLLSSPQVMEARALWMKELQNQNNSTKTARDHWSENVQFIHRAVMEEKPIQKIDKNSRSLSPTLKDDDDWPEEENCGYKWTPMFTVNQDDVSFSDLEGDDDISSLTLNSKSTSNGTYPKRT